VTAELPAKKEEGDGVEVVTVDEERALQGAIQIGLRMVRTLYVRDRNLYLMRSLICNSVCRLSVCLSVTLVHPAPYLRTALDFTAIFLHYMMPNQQRVNIATVSPPPVVIDLLCSEKTPTFVFLHNS